MAQDEFDAEYEAERAIRVLTEEQPEDALAAVMRACVSALPGPIASILQERLPDYRAARVIEFLKQLKFDLGQVQADTKKLAEDFGLLFSHIVFQEVPQTSEPVKFDAYRAVLLNSCQPDPPSKAERDAFIRILDQVTTLEVLVLAVFRDQHAFGSAYKTSAHTAHGSGTIGALLQYLKPFDYQQDLIEWAVRDLINIGIVRPDALPHAGSVTHLSTEISKFLDGFGRRFVNFITLPDAIRNADKYPQ